MNTATERLTGEQRELLRKGIALTNLEMSDAALEAIEMHLSLVYRWRGGMNLISIANDRELVTHHALDSLILLPLIKQSQHVLDIGTGAGFPGVMLAAARPDVHFTLLDSRQRRIEFLRMASMRAGLKNVSLVCARVEDSTKLDKDKNLANSDTQISLKFDTLVARAVTSLPQLMQITTSLRRSGQRLIAMKGRYPVGELEALEKAYGDQIQSLRVEKLEVPFLGAQRHAVIVECRESVEPGKRRSSS